MKHTKETASGIKGFKAFDKNFKCRDLQYAVGQEYTIEDGKELAICPNNANQAGLHFCENPMDIFAYYPPAESRFAEVEVKGDCVKGDNDTKVATSKLYISAEISLHSLINRGVKFILSKVDFKDAKATNTGNYSAATVEGEESVAISIGIEGKSKGSLGCWIVLSEWDTDVNPIVRKSVQAFHVDGEIIKADTFYQLIDGKAKEVI